MQLPPSRFKGKPTWFELGIQAGQKFKQVMGRLPSYRDQVETGINPKQPATWPKDLQNRYLKAVDMMIPKERDDSPLQFYNRIDVGDITRGGNISIGPVSDTPYSVHIDEQTGIPIFD